MGGFSFRPLSPYNEKLNANRDFIRGFWILSQLKLQPLSKTSCHIICCILLLPPLLPGSDVHRHASITRPQIYCGEWGINIVLQTSLFPFSEREGEAFARGPGRLPPSPDRTSTVENGITNIILQTSLFPFS